MGRDDGDLTDGERAFVAALALFAGGFTIDAAKSVCGSDLVDDLVPGLVQRSVIGEAGSSPARYRLRDDVRRRALDALAGTPDYDLLRDRHLAWARAYAERGAAALDGPGQREWLDALSREHDNFRRALEWGTARPDCEAALGLAAVLGRFWEVRGHAREGRRWLDLALRQNPSAPPSLRARAASSAGLLAFRDRDYGAARTVYDESLTLHWDAGDRLGASAVLHAMGNIAFQQRDWEEARRLFEEALNIGRELHDDRVIAASLTNLGAILEVQGNHATARAFYDEALGLWRTLGDEFNAAAVLGNLADIAAAEGDWAQARRLGSETLEARRSVGDKAGMASSLRRLAAIAVRQGDLDAARSFETERRRMSGAVEEGGWLSRVRRRFT